ncbi:MAG: hypothetical protein WC201_02515 [Bacilli bacterium]
MYWNSRRIFKHLNDWAIYMCMNNQEIRGYIPLSLWDEKVMEIYALETVNAEIGISLLQTAIGEAKQTNHREILVMTDNHSLSYLCCKKIHFVETGFYQSFRKEPL